MLWCQSGGAQYYIAKLYCQFVLSQCACVIVLSLVNSYKLQNIEMRKYSIICCREMECTRIEEYNYIGTFISGYSKAHALFTMLMNNTVCCNCNSIEWDVIVCKKELARDNTFSVTVRLTDILSIQRIPFDRCMIQRRKQNWNSMAHMFHRFLH
jgi:hypothetical protein